MGEPASSSELIRYFWPWIWLALDGKHSVVCADQVLCHLICVVLFLVTSARALWEHLLGYLGLDEGMLSSPKLFSWRSFSIW